MPSGKRLVGALRGRAFLCVLLALSTATLGCWPGATVQPSVEPGTSAPPPAAEVTASPATPSPVPATAELVETETPTAEPEPPTVEATPTSEVAPGKGSTLTLSANPEDDLLFRVTTTDGSRIYYCGLEAEGALQLTHIILDDGSGDLATILFDERLLPVQWILPGLTAAVYPPPGGYEGEGEQAIWFDPQAALHLVLDGGEESSLTADILPGDLEALLEDMEAATELSFDGARAFLGNHAVSWDQLVALARAGGPDQPRYIAAAVGFSSAAAALGLARATTAWPAARIAGLAAPAHTIWRPVIQVGAGVLGGVLAGEIGEVLDPEGGPSVEVLLCRGAAKYGLCHYLFFYRDQVGACVSFCRTSLRCFTDICMPMTISADLAMRMRNALGR